jgi:hypothetical protein
VNAPKGIGVDANVGIYEHERITTRGFGASIPRKPWPTRSAGQSNHSIGVTSRGLGRVIVTRVVYHNELPLALWQVAGTERGERGGQKLFTVMHRNDD